MKHFREEQRVTLFSERRAQLIVRHWPQFIKPEELTPEAKAQQLLSLKTDVQTGRP